MPRRILAALTLGLLCACHSLPPLPAWPAGSPPQSGLARAANTQALMPADELLKRMRQAELVILGEQHDNPYHHALELWTVQQLASRGSLHAVVMEMLDAEQQPALQALAQARPLPSESQVRERLGWQERKWPWQSYGPLIMTALRAGIPLYAGQPTQAELNAARQRRDLPPLPAEAIAILSQALRDGHCGLLPEQRLPAMLWVQYRRDQQMAASLERLRTPGRQVLLITGNGHARRDSGVPLQLQHPVLSVSLTSDLSPNAENAYDWQWFSPATVGDNYCEALKRQLNQREPTP